jgi:branched-chain amino acid transport system ATP-binding protein
LGLEVKDLSIAYGKNTVVRGISMNVRDREIVALLGHNGAGKTTILKGIIGLLSPNKGIILFDGTNVVGRPLRENIRNGMLYLGAQNANFSDLTVKSNLELAAHIIIDGLKVVENRMKEVFQLFPILEERKYQRAKSLSGGERKMLEIGMALMTRPMLMLVDEVSLGLSPLLVGRVMACMKEVNERYGTSILLAEQNLKQALLIADRAYIIKIGEIMVEDKAENLRKQGQELFKLF